MSLLRSISIKLSLGLIVSCSLLFFIVSVVLAQGPVVDNVGDAVDGDYSSGNLTLREAIEDVASPGDTITFDSSIAGQTIHLSGPLTVGMDLTIDGALNNITISGDTGGDGTPDVQVFNMTDGNVTLSRLTFTKGITTGDGGGIVQFGGILTLEHSTVASNTASNGGGIAQSGGVLTLTHSSVVSNYASSQAGGLYSTSATAKVGNSTFSNNRASGGTDGVYTFLSSLDVENSTFSHQAYSLVISQDTANIKNSTFSDHSSAGVFVASGTANIYNSTFSGTSGSSDIFNFNSTIQVTNSILASPNGCSASGSTITGSNNLITDDTNCGSGAGNLGAVTNLDPSLADNGGETQTHALLVGSNAINAGAIQCRDETGTPLATDQRGVTRPQGSSCDIGAYEFDGPVLSIEKTVAPEGGVIANGQTVTYTIVVSNTGPGNATGVEVTDNLPSEVSGNSLDTTVDINAGQQATFVLTGTLSGLVDQTITNTASFTHTSGTGSDSAAFLVTNGAPEFTSTPVSTATVGMTYTYNVAASDPDAGDTLTITGPVTPGWLSLSDNGDGTASLSGTPGSGDVGAHHVELLITDSGNLTDTQSFSITVTAETPSNILYMPIIMKNQ